MVLNDREKTGVACAHASAGNGVDTLDQNAMYGRSERQRDAAMVEARSIARV